MANHKSALKRVRQSNAKRLSNKYNHKSARTAIKELREETDKKAASDKLSAVSAMIDKLAKKNIIHKNKASNLKSSLARHINGLS